MFDDFDARIEAGARCAVAEYEMFGPHAHDHPPAILGRECRRITPVTVKLQSGASTVMVPASLRTVTSMKFIAGAPMKPATNLLAGLP